MQNSFDQNLRSTCELWVIATIAKPIMATGKRLHAENVQSVFDIILVIII